MDRQEGLERADALLAHAAVGGPTGDLDAERQGPGGGGDDLGAGRLGDHRGLADVPAAQGRERPETAVLLAHHEVQRQRALEPDARRLQRARDGEVRGGAGLHVAGAAAEHRALADLRGERVGPEPVVRVAGRYDVEVALEHEPGHALAGGRADDADGLLARHLDAREPRVLHQLVQVDVPPVDLGVQVAQHGGGVLLHLDLGVGAAHARDPHQLHQRLDQHGLVEVAQHGTFGGGQLLGSAHVPECAVLPPAVVRGVVTVNGHRRLCLVRLPAEQAHGDQGHHRGEGEQDPDRGEGRARALSADHHVEHPVVEVPQRQQLRDGLQPVG